jgi:ribosome-associated translation inhibitor RaiA
MTTGNTAMQLPLQITFRDIPHSDAIEADIRERAGKLEEFYPRLMSCRVVVEEQQRRQHQGKLFEVRIDLHVPGHEFAVNRDSNEDIYVALRDAFDSAKRILEDEIRLERRAVKTHEQPSHGHITRLNPIEGNGIIETPDGSEVFFSRDNVVSPPFEHLEVGTEVQFLLESGKDTLLAKRVSAGKHRFGG